MPGTPPTASTTAATAAPRHPPASDAPDPAAERSCSTTSGARVDQNGWDTTLGIVKYSIVAFRAASASKDLHVKITTARNRRAVHTYSEIPESMRGWRASKPWFSSRPAPPGE